MSQMQKRNFAISDETRTFDKGKVDLIKLGGITFGRGTFQPGWKWSESVKPLVKTKSCEAPHLQYIISGRMHIVMDDGSEAEFGPGDLALVPPGHDAWIVGNEPVVAIDIDGMVNYAKPA
jgi:ethanolamine utilization protein EutQ (cupin superfamily)